MNLPEALPLEITSYIDGHWKTVARQVQSEILFPATGKPIATLYEANADEVSEAVDAAKRTFDSGTWSQASVEHRKRVLRRVHELILERTDLLASYEVAHTGAPVSQTLGRHVPRAAMNFEFFSEYISQASNPVFEQNPDYVTYVSRDPVGVAGLIAPWNAPLALATMKVAGAIAFGNSCVLKPSELTPLSFVPLMQIFQDAGLPPGVVNMVNGQGSVTGQALVEHPDIGVIAFTGGTATGRLIGETAGKGIKKVVTELGGKSANIIFADADLERALDAALLAIFSNNGQQCLAGSRILLQENIADEFIAKFVARVEALRLGNPYSRDTEIGPLISANQLERVLAYARQAKASDGIELLTGGERATEFDSGFYIRPTVVKARSNTLPVCQEEIFGPFATLLTFKDADEAFAIANDSEFGLVAYVWSDNVHTIMRATGALRAGTVWVNTPLTREIRAPFGGYKHSGVGRDGGDWSRTLFTEEKTITIPAREFPIAKLGYPGK